MISNFPDRGLFNLGGLETFQFCPAPFIQQLPAITSNRITSAPVFTGNFKFYQGYSTLEMMTFTETPTKDDNGVYYDWEITGFMPGDSADLIDLMATLELYRHVVITKDLSGIYRFVGFNNPLDFTAVFNPGADTKSARGYTFTFSGSSPNRAPAYIVS